MRTGSKSAAGKQILFEDVVYEGGCHVQAETRKQATQTEVGGQVSSAEHLSDASYRVL